MNIELVIDGLQFPESPFWSEREGCLYFAEWLGDRVCALQGGQVRLICQTASGAGPCAVAQDKKGYFWVCLYSACQVVHIDPQGQILKVIDRYQGQPLKGPNDLALDGQGGLYFTDGGDFEEDWRTGRPAGALYYLTPHGELLRVGDKICFPNGMALAPDGKSLFVNEHRKNRTLKYTLRPDGTLQPPKVFYTFDEDCLMDDEHKFELGPDGMCFDDRGRLWIAHYGGGKVAAVNLQGELEQIIHLPRGRQPTNAGFQPGANGLFITEAELGLIYRVQL